MTTTLIKNRSKKAGLPPGALVHIGEQKIIKSTINIFNYSENSIEEKEAADSESLLGYKNKQGVTWINIEGISDIKVIEKTGSVFGIHALVLEDILNTDQRPKLEDFESNIYIVLKMLSFDNSKENIITEQVSFILGSNYLISFQEGIEGDVFNPVRNRIRTNKGRIRKEGSDYLLYSLIDVIVDNYFIILEKTGEKIEQIEKELISKPAQKHLQKIYNLKKEIISLRKSVWPLRELLNELTREDSKLMSETTKMYLRDVYDHTIQIMDNIETFREILSVMIEIYLSGVSNKMNEVIRFLTIISTIFMPPTLVAGIYGMNFKFMPELDWKWTYPAVLVFMLFISLSMLLYFRKKKWL